VIPQQAAAEASAEASRWIGESPHILDVLDWHRSACRACTDTLRCAEYGEIICEYGAGEAGAAVFFPAG
jgi:hypothetical protein